MIYIDPPYGIKFGSNWQVQHRKRDVKDGKLEDATREAEQIKAFRDTLGTALEKCGGRRGTRKVRHLNGASGTVTAIGDRRDPPSASPHRRPRGAQRHATVG